MAAQIGKALKHIVNPASTAPVRTRVDQSVLDANLDANRNTLFGRIFDDEKGLGGGKHAQRIQDRREITKKDKEIYEKEMGAHRESLSQQQALRQEAQNAGESAENLSRIEKSIKAADDKMRQTKRKTGFVDNAWNNTADTFRAMNSGNAAQIATKWGAVAAAGVVVNGTGRALTGGGVTYNSSGERDIMGIPFV